MTTYLLDTNIILRFSNPSDAQHELVANSVAAILANGDECYLAPQVLIEMWVVATRPTDVNGLGWSTTYTRNIIEQLMQRFPIAEELPQLFPTWLELVSTQQISGKRTHDARIVALMKTASIEHILTLNPSDFSNIPDITVVHPRNVMDGE
ncbi:MAG: type II toxin-antitoxin system VapC family toxin [Chloroflexi bacterium]|nr:type II toxin-antitoxin system VapC family toxin [Chloroflexota bacterium]